MTSFSVSFLPINVKFNQDENFSFIFPESIPRITRSGFALRVFNSLEASLHQKLLQTSEIALSTAAVLRADWAEKDKQKSKTKI